MIAQFYPNCLSAIARLEQRNPVIRLRKNADVQIEQNPILANLIVRILLDHDCLTSLD